MNKQTVVLYIQKDIHKERNTEGIHTRRGIQKDIHTERHIQHESIHIKEQTYGGTYTRSGYTHRGDIYTQGYIYYIQRGYTQKKTNIRRDIDTEKTYTKRGYIHKRANI